MRAALHRAASAALALVVAAACAQGVAATGQMQVGGRGGDGPVTVFHPVAARDATAPQAGNGRLVVVSHGSGGWPGTFGDLVQALVAAGYVVAFPQHAGDQRGDNRQPGPDSWKRRPLEVSRAIDAVAADARLAPLLRLDRVGMYGMSAGGHTALSLAGGAWSPALYRRHCEQNLEADFHTCVGLATELTGGALDGAKLWVARAVIGSRYEDATRYTHTDPRIAAIAAAVPAAADFDPATLSTPVVPLALLTAGQDAWLVPRFHAQRVLAACLPRCEHLVDLPAGGHGAYLSPLPPQLTGLAARLLGDPPGFDRTALREVDRRVVGFFDRHLAPRAAAAAAAASAASAPQ